MGDPELVTVPHCLENLIGLRDSKSPLEAGKFPRLHAAVE